MTQMRNVGQFLKALLKPATQGLGEWGYTVNNTNRIVYPPDFDNLFDRLLIIQTIRGLRRQHESPGLRTLRWF